MRYLTGLLLLSMAAVAIAQGEDSLPSERDWQVINEMLSGLYVNGNQAYFERRTNVEENLRHPSRSVRLTRTNLGFAWLESDEPMAEAMFDVSLVHDTENNVPVAIFSTGEDRCRYEWTREAEQFRARAATSCSSPFPSELVLGATELWIYPGEGANIAMDNPYKLHRAREFSCYADVPGVGGGRDIPYERYENISLHDQGDAYWFDTKETPSRLLGISLFLVDWPINNYNGIFTRDSLVVYISEKIGDEIKEHGYAFTEPDANRVGVNLKWMLASCFMLSNRDAAPTM